MAKQTKTDIKKSEGEQPSEAVQDSSIEEAPRGEVLTTDEAVDKLERNSDPNGPSPRSY